MERHPKPPALVPRPLPPAPDEIRPLANSPPLRLAPRLRTLYQARILARLLPAHPHLHAITLSDLAREWGADRVSIEARLTGKVEISGADLLFMADELGVTPHELLAGIQSYLTPEERASLKLKNRVASSARYAQVRDARKAAGDPPRKYSPRTGRRAPIHLLVMERLPPDQRKPLPPAPKKGAKG